MLNDFENDVLRMLLDGALDELATLRCQLARVHVTNRVHTGVGFFAELCVPVGLPRLAKRDRIILGGVQIVFPGKPAAAAGAVILIEDGALAMLEGYTYEGRWPESIASWQLHPLGAERGSLELTKKLRI